MPVLHDIIEREAFLAKGLGNLNDAVLRRVTLLAHEQAERLFGNHRRVASQPAIGTHDAIERILGRRIARHEIIIHAARRAFRPQTRTLWIILEPHLGIGVPQNAVSLRRHHHRDDDADIGLDQQQFLVPAIDLIIGGEAEPVNPLIGLQREAIFHFIGRRVGDSALLDRLRCLRLFARQQSSRRIMIGQRAAALVDAHAQFLPDQFQRVGRLAYGKGHRFRLANDDQAALGPIGCAQIGVHPYDRRGIEDHRLGDAVQPKLNPAAQLLKVERHIIRRNKRLHLSQLVQSGRRRRGPCRYRRQCQYGRNRTHPIWRHPPSPHFVRHYATVHRAKRQ